MSTVYNAHTIGQRFSTSVKLPLSSLTLTGLLEKGSLKPVEVVDVFDVAKQTQDVISCDVGRRRFVIDEATHVSLQHNENIYP